MSEQNKKGEECDCGSTAEHERGPGCTLSVRGGGAVEVAPAYFVGTCLACGKEYDSRVKKHECMPRPTPEERLAALEAAVQRIEARAEVERAQMLDPHHGHGSQRHCPGCLRAAARQAEARSRPTPPGVFPQMGTHPAVGVATVDGKATCPQCPESVESRATYARVPEHAAPTPMPAERYLRASQVQEVLRRYRATPCNLDAASLVTVLAQEFGVDLDAEHAAPTPAEAAIFERGGYVPRTDDLMHCCGSPSPLHSAGCRVVKGLEGMVTKPPTPAAMLGEAADLLKRAMDAMQAAGIFAGSGLALAKMQNARDIAMLAKRDAEARETGAGDRIESRACNQEGHLWNGGRCVYCGADRAEEERRGGPAVDKARED